jgi:hypothetical protein
MSESEQYMNVRDDCYEPDHEDLAYELYKESQLEGYRIEYAYIDRELRDYRKHTDRQLRELSKERKSFARDCKLEHEFNLAADCYYGEPSIVESCNNKASRTPTRKDKRRQKTEHRKAKRFLRNFDERREKSCAVIGG